MPFHVMPIYEYTPLVIPRRRAASSFSLCFSHRAFSTRDRLSSQRDPFQSFGFWFRGPDLAIEFSWAGEELTAVVPADFGQHQRLCLVVAHACFDHLRHEERVVTVAHHVGHLRSYPRAETFE
jgi:hypothetical protein